MKRRYSDNDQHFGPFTFSKHNCAWRPIGIVIDSGHDESGGCHVLFHGFGYALICELPAIIKPWRRWVPTGHYEWATSPDAGYWDEHRREYGFRLSDGFLQVFIGPQTHDSDTTKSWCCHLPWTQWRFIRFSLYNLEGNHFWTQLEEDRCRGWQRFQEQREAEEKCPKAVFEFDDYDGKRITATTQIEEREWKFGDGWFKWLSLFRKPMIRRSLDIKFSEEVGPEKGSWKGGTMGHSIDMLPGENHESAFRRYCDQEHSSKSRSFRLKFVGSAND